MWSIQHDSILVYYVVCPKYWDKEQLLLFVVFNYYTKDRTNVSKISYEDLKPKLVAKLQFPYEFVPVMELHKKCEY